MKPKSKFSVLLEWLFEKLGIIETYEISKEEMCKNARDICDRNCEMCAWKSEGENK